VLRGATYCQKYLIREFLYEEKSYRNSEAAYLFLPLVNHYNMFTASE